MRDVKTRVGVEDRGSQKLRRASQEVTRFERAWRGTARGVQRSMRLMERGFGRLRRTMGTLMRRAKFMMIGFQLTATIMGVQMVRAAMKYERALRNVTSLMAGAGMAQAQLEENFRSMDMQIRAMAVRTGQMPDDLAAGMYNVVSATFDGEAGLKVLEAAAVGAFAGLSDTNTVTGLLTKTLQAYRQENETNNEVAAKSMETMDAYFMAVNRGMFTFDDLANKMGALPSTAAAFGVSLQDLLAFLSTATVRGVGLDEAITGVRQAMLQIGKLTPQTEKAAEAVFGQNWEERWGPQALAAKGLLGVLQDLNTELPEIPANVMEAAIAMEDEGGDAAAYLAEQIGGNIAAVAELFPNIRALKAVLAVTGPGLKLYGENMEFMADSSGAAGRAQEEMAKSAEGSLQFLKAAWETFKIDVGNIALPFIKEIADSMVHWWGDLPMRFAEQGGLFDDDMWLQGVPDSQAEQRMGEAAQEFWAAASPSEKVSWILRTAWSDAITNLTEWFNNGGGKEKITGLGNSLGTGIANTLRAVAGIETEDMTGSLPYQFGKAFVDGFTAAFEEFDWKSFFQSTIGTGLAAIIGGIIGGPGGALGAGLGASAGTNPIVTGVAGAAAWKGAGWLLSRGGGAAAGGAAAGAAGGGGLSGAAYAAYGAMGGGGVVATAAIAASVVGVLGMLGISMWNIRQMYEKATVDMGLGGGDTAAEVTAAYGAAAQAEIEAQGLEGMAAWTAGMAAMSQMPTTTTAGAGPSYGLPISVGDYSNIQGMGDVPMERAADDMSSAASESEIAARNFDRAVGVFGNWVRSMPYMDVVSLGAGAGNVTTGRSGGGGASANALGSRGTAYKPTLMMVGESGTEDYDIRPRRGGGGPGGGDTKVYANITVTESGDAKQTAAYIVRELEKAIGNG